MLQIFDDDGAIGNLITVFWNTSQQGTYLVVT